MKRPFALLPLVFAATCAGCAAPLWEETAHLPLGASGARLFVPRTFEPIVSGSIYPDRGRPAPARGLPAVLVLTRDLAVKRVAEPLGRRGLVALVARAGSPVADGLARLRALPEAGGATGLFLQDPDGASLAAALADGRVAAIVLTGALPEIPAAHPPILALETGVPRGKERADVAERRFEAGKLPDRALQDAADWLAGRLAPR